MTAACRCAFATHENPACPEGKKKEAQAKIYAGLYGSRSGMPPVRRTSPSALLRSVRLLNPDFEEDDEDAAARRFAQLEID